ncbi:MAG: DNA-binding transcriptional dual regulator Crp [bacterium ADurb.Bin236]|nr:MAG: DNA-binding transcriptional dual regulator Crp [bacterium ADurb.Bin236]HOY61792.1 cyclic nucleotide-binding domain-containing protein [bacterium]HPN93657.1 cyclic nucleotide-binding domain-containing protein [bacterium]
MSNGASTQSIRNLQPGEYLCLQGEDSNEIFVLRSGSLHIYVVDSDGPGAVRPERVDSEGMLVGVVDTAGAFIGEIGAILREPRSASIRVSDDGPAQVMVIDLRGKGFDATVMQNPKIGFSLSKTIAQRLGMTSHSINRIDSLSLKAKGFLEETARSLYEMIDELDKAAQAAQKELPLLAEAKQMESCQIGRMVSKYGSLPMDIYGTIGVPFSAHHTIYHNRIYQKKAGGEPAPQPAGDPKPGVAAFNPGDVICPDKSIDKSMYFLLAGKLEVFVGMRAIETLQEKGAIFGENAIFGELERSSGVRALTEVHAMPVPAAQIEPYMMKKPPLVVHTLKMFAKRLPLLNATMMKSAQQMSQLVSLLGNGPEGCLTALEALAPRIKSETADLGDAAAPFAAKAESLLSDLASGFEMINQEYEQICSDTGFRPKSYGGADSAQPFAAPKFNFATKIEELETLDSEHINFVLNPKKDQFRACSVEFGHIELLKQAKVAEASWNEFIFGRIINYGESFPSQFLVFDMTPGAQKFDRDYVLRSLQFFVERAEQEVALVYKDGAICEVIHIPDHISVEGEEVADESVINEIIAAFRKDPSDRENLAKLNALYWDMIIGVVQKKLPRVKDNIIPFEEKDLQLINFGLLDPEFLRDDSNVPAQMAEDKKFSPGEGHPLGYIYLTDMLQDVYKQAFGQNELDKLEEDKKKAEAEFKACQDRIRAIVKGRSDMVMSFPGGQNAAKFVQQLDGIVVKTAVLDRKMKSGQSITMDEREKIKQIKNMKTQIAAHIMKYITTLKGRVSEDQLTQFRTIGEELEGRVLEELKLQDELAKKTQKINDHIRAMKTMSIKQKENVYKNEIIRIKKYVLMTAKKCKMDSASVLVGVKDIATKTRVRDIINLFLADNVDPEIFDSAQTRIKQLGLPTVMLVPGSGNSVYDWEKHMFIVPLIPEKTLDESIANAFVEFHWDMDEDKSMRESYGEMKIYKKLSITKLKQQLTKDYLVWATQESKGWKKLDKEVRPWFQVKIGKQKLDKV